ncbi:amino acid/polyamine/organocation transporter (APC superfamily) [Rhodobacter viridis]|uniref:Amino acid/polyamine/organocation transporter (APC superfamily) n=1 Tax=Rhodobacter viridis TaxID=1054202 RepID=A0A318U2F9_9RHOB|nr:APC family permease [Rhodobacter viridis]PYF12638.1 amino acid/polyamine/organocation transporter (APC superfamily) [Rhodobacter viridis]
MTSLERSSGALKRDHLSFLDVVAQAVGTIAPSGTPAFVILGVFATAGNGTWLAYLFATLALLVLSVTITAFSSRSASPGALYAFAGQGLGPFWGTVAGWSLVIAYLFTAGAVVAGSVSYALEVLHLAFGAFDNHLPAVLLSALAIGLAFAIAWRSIRLSTRLSLTLEAITVGAVLIVLGVALWQGAAGADQAQLTLQGVASENLRLGLVLAFFSFVGFESATVLGHEAKDPLRVIPRSVITTVLATGLFFTVSAYVLVAAFQGEVTGLGGIDAPLSALAARLGLGVLGPVIAAGVSASFFASALASINAGARVIYLLSRHGIIHGRAGDAHEVHETPHVAVAISALVVAALSLPLTLAGNGLLDIFAWLGTIATLGFLAAYILVAIGAPVFLARRGELRPHHVAISVASVGLLSLPLIGLLYPVPPAPFNLLPYAFLGLLGLGVVHFLWLRWSNPQVLRRIEDDLETATQAVPAE